MQHRKKLKGARLSAARAKRIIRAMLRQEQQQEVGLSLWALDLMRPEAWRILRDALVASPHATAADREALAQLQVVSVTRLVDGPERPESFAAHLMATDRTNYYAG